MNHKQFRRYLDRDGGCVHCGAEDTAVPHHRLNRGMGGAGKRSRANNPSNLLSLCAVVNGLIESDEDWARMARDYGWKLRPGQYPEAVAVWYPLAGGWYLLNDDFGREDVAEAAL